MPRDRNCRRYWKNKPYRRAFAELTFDLNICIVSFGHAIHHGQSKTRAALSLGSEEWFHAAPFCGLIHAGAGVRDFHVDRLLTRMSANGDPSAFGHGIHGV